MQSLARKENLKLTFITNETKMARKLFLLDKLIQYFIGKPFVERQLMSQQGKKVKVFFYIIFQLSVVFMGLLEIPSKCRTSQKDFETIFSTLTSRRNRFKAGKKFFNDIFS